MNFFFKIVGKTLSVCLSERFKHKKGSPFWVFVLGVPILVFHAMYSVGWMDKKFKSADDQNTVSLVAPLDLTADWSILKDGIWIYFSIWKPDLSLDVPNLMEGGFRFLSRRKCDSTWSVGYLEISLRLLWRLSFNVLLYKTLLRLQCHSNEKSLLPQVRCNYFYYIQALFSVCWVGVWFLLP